MALINCPECGNTISDKATSCPHCGCPLTVEPEKAIFRLCREQKALFCAVKYEVYLDYEYWGILKNGDSLTAELELGIHHLKLIDKNNFNKAVYDADFSMDDNLTFTFSAAMNVNMRASSPSSSYGQAPSNRAMPAAYAPPVRSSAPVSSSGGRKCPRCGGTMTVQTVSEARKSGCGTILLYVILALTIFGLLIVIPLMLRKKTETVTYAVCQSCGFKRRIS